MNSSGKYLSRWRVRLVRFRAPIVVGAALLFCGGAYWSFRDPVITVGEIRLWPFAALAFLVVPSLLYGGIGLLLLGRTVRVRIPLGKATVVSTYAYLAEILPLPGGAIVRAGVLVNAGATVQRSAAVVLLTAVLWMAIAMTGAGLALYSYSAALALPLAIIGMIFTLGVTVWLVMIAGMKLAMQTLAHRMTGIALLGLRLKFAFAALGVSIGLTESLPFVFATVIGSASSIIPAGLGVSESLAALVAKTGSIASSAAFLAVALDRMLSLAGGVLLVMGAHLRMIWGRTTDSRLVLRGS